MIVDPVFRLGRVHVGFTGLPLPLRSDSFLPQFLSEEAADISLDIYQDTDGTIPAPLIYENAFYRIYASNGRIWAENSAHGTLGTWGYSILHYDYVKPRLQLLSPTHACTLDQVISGMMMESLLLAREHALLHASVIEICGGALLFTAPSGTGKSTQAELWRRSRGAVIRNGDRALLHFENGRAIVSGLPYAGTSGICEQFDLPIHAVVVLCRGKENRAEELRPTEAVKCLLNQIALQPWHREDVQAALNLAARLTQCVPVLRLACLPDERAVDCLERSLKWNKPQRPGC